MKTSCERCGLGLPADGEAFICSYECTFCPACVSEMESVCPNCDGELSRRPQRKIPTSRTPRVHPLALPAGIRRRTIWMASFGVWAAMTLAASIWIYQYDRAVGTPMHFYEEIPLEASDIFSYAPLTPFVLALALRFPLRRRKWLRPLLVLCGGAVVFTLIHVCIRAATYPVWDTHVHNFVSIWMVHGHSVGVRWDLVSRLFMLDWFNDVTSAYIPIVVVGYAISYNQRFREREVRTAQLEGQLAKAHLESLKSQLRPHFLFNTMHSISALMHSDVRAADKMMCRLSDLLRMVLEDGSLQTTNLTRELEFIGGYLEIEKVRFQDRLHVELDISSDTFDAEVPHLLLQPLVENAIRHGIAKRSARGELRIEAKRDHHDLSLCISDNGPGLVEGDASASKSGLGLRATRERLQTLYGADHSFSIRTLQAGGVQVCVRIPFRVEARPSIYEIVPEIPQPILRD